MTRPATIDIDRMKAYEWLKNGAQPTETVRAILRFKGVLYYKHLQRGVLKNAMTPEDAELKFRAWVDEKEARIEARVKAVAAEKKEKASQISGTKRSPKKKETVQDDDELLNVNLARAAAAETAEDSATEETQTPADTATETPAETTEGNTEETSAEETSAEETTGAQTEDTVEADSEKS